MRLKQCLLAVALLVGISLFLGMQFHTYGAYGCSYSRCIYYGNCNHLSTITDELFCHFS
jgi:hypothetical protein